MTHGVKTGEGAYGSNARGSEEDSGRSPGEPRGAPRVAGEWDVTRVRPEVENR